MSNSLGTCYLIYTYSWLKRRTLVKILHGDWQIQNCFEQHPKHRDFSGREKGTKCSINQFWHETANFTAQMCSRSRTRSNQRLSFCSSPCWESHWWQIASLRSPEDKSWGLLLYMQQVFNQEHSDYAMKLLWSNCPLAYTENVSIWIIWNVDGSLWFVRHSENPSFQKNIVLYLICFHCSNLCSSFIKRNPRCFQTSTEH